MRFVLFFLLSFAWDVASHAQESQAITCTGACTVTVNHVLNWQDAISLPLTSDQVADYMALWALFLAAAVAVLGAKAIYNRFRIDHHE